MLPYYNSANFEPIFIKDQNIVENKIDHKISDFKFFNQDNEEINENDISDCKWWIADADTDAIDAPIQYGGIGALRNHLRTACYKSGALQRPRHIASRRNHIRLSSDVNGKCWTTSNGG